MSNTNAGVSFVVADADSYRFVQEDLGPGDEQYSPLVDLPNGVRFEAAADPAGQALRFNRLGSFCKPTVGTCAAAPASLCKADETSTRCNDVPVADYVGNDGSVSGGAVITLVEVSTDLRRTIRVAPGGRVLPQP
jgi:hypothetical protein